MFVFSFSLAVLIASIFLLVVLTVASDFRCDFSNERWPWYGEQYLWSCLIKNQAAQQPGAMIQSFTNGTDTLGLDMSGNNQLRFLPVNISATLTNLVTIQIYYCNITSVGANHFHGLVDLKYLHLGWNHIATVAEDAFNDNIKLEKLMLHSNKIKHLSQGTFKSQANLKELYLHRNRIRTIEPSIFCNLISLEILDLHRNKLIKLEDDTFEGLEKLKSLDLDKNRIESIESEAFEHFASLEKVHLKGNECISKHFNSTDFGILKNETITKCKPENINEKIMKLIEMRFREHKAALRNEIANLNASMLLMMQELKKIIKNDNHEIIED